MFRKELPEGRGMLFDFQREQDVSFWMQNTYIPLEQVFFPRGRADPEPRRKPRAPFAGEIPSGGRCARCWR